MARAATKPSPYKSSASGSCLARRYPDRGLLPRVLPLVLVAPLGAAGLDTSNFRITVMDEATGRGVPMVELRTTNEIRLHTDSAGHAADLL
jgi:hypothetical protein